MFEIEKRSVAKRNENRSDLGKEGKKKEDNETKCK